MIEEGGYGTWTVDPPVSGPAEGARASTTTCWVQEKGFMRRGWC